MKEKGFTLVELLAVIVILAVISLIATPMVLGVIEKSKRSAAIESANGIMDAAEKNMIESMLNGSENNRYDFPGDTKLSYRGEKPESGTLLIDSNGNMSITIKINGYCVRKRFKESTPQVIEESNCSIEDSELAYAENYHEDILNGTDPVLKDSLIPVTISDDGTVTYADTKKEWYNYSNKKWANAVILIDSPSQTYSVGDTILESDIESYFVWIPKYSYKLWDLGNYTNTTDGIDTSKAHSIDIRFGTTNTNDTNSNECTTPLVSGESGNCAVDDYMTHPAFITLGVNGLWVGKFETTGDIAQLTVKPNLASLRSQNVASMFNLALNYKTSLNSHMMKNTEWGAVSYLHHSKYGSSSELMINNNSDFLTGYASVKSPTCGYTGDNRNCNKYGITSDITQGYNTEIGYKASTTGNISGIYDMAGGAHEYMAAYIDRVGKDSGFATLPTGKYVDIYNALSAITTYKYRILGDATGEMGPFGVNIVISDKTYCQSSWYSDVSYFVDSGHSWFIRGGGYDNGNQTGIFNFDQRIGDKYEYIGFRLVLAPNA